MSARPKVVITNPIAEAVRERLAAHALVDVNTSVEPWSAGELGARLGNATAMMGFMTDRVDAALLRRAPDLRLIACALKGYDSYDVEACTHAGVWLSIVPDLLTEPTAELAIGLAIGLGRQVLTGDALMRQGRFQGWRAQLYGQGLHRAVVAVVGLGRVGRSIVDRLQGFGCAAILGVDPDAQVPGVENVPLHTAVGVADYLFLAAPLTPATRHLVGHAALRDAKPGQLIVNVGRGSVADEMAIAQALEDGHIGGYAADVFACEDWALADRPLAVPARLLASPRTLFTPHLGSAVRRVRLAIEHRAADNILALLRGERPPDAINDPGPMPLGRYRAASAA